MTERVVLITGALVGIGRATATAFAREGGAVVVYRMPFLLVVAWPPPPALRLPCDHLRAPSLARRRVRARNARNAEPAGKRRR